MKIYGWSRGVCLIQVIMLCLLVVTIGFSGEPIKKQKPPLTLQKPTKAIDVAIALLDAGQAQHMMLNSHLSAFDWGDHGRPAGTFRGWSYIPSIFLSIGVPDGPWAPLVEDPVTKQMVSMGPSVSGVGRYPLDMLDSRQAPDWGPKAGSLGKLHSGEMRLEDIYDQTSLDKVPLVATSTYPETWPKNENGYRFWPGFWAKDPKTGKIAMDTVAASSFDFRNVTLPWKYRDEKKDTVLVGKFASDKEIYFEMNDYDVDDKGSRYAEHDDIADRGYALGIQVNFQGLSYGRSYAEDILFFPMQIINNSTWDYKNVYLNIINDSDVPELITRPGSASLNDRMDWMTYIRTEYDEEKDTTYAYNMAYIYDWRWGGAETFPGPEYKVVPALKLLDTPFAPEGHSHYSDGIDNDGDGLIDEPPVRNPITNRIIDGEKLGITGWHWYRWEDRPGEVETERGELIAYKLMAGDNTGLTSAEDEAYFHASPDGTLDPHFDSPAGIRDLYPTGLDCMFEFSTGPFDLPAGDTTVVSFAVVFGEDTNDVKFNARTAQFMYELNYQGADAPPPPKVTAVAFPDSVVLYWDYSSEDAIDIMTGYKDFEGYKIYKTTAPPNMNEWGDKIYDGNGTLIGFVPLAQFDLVNTVSGLDPIYPHLNKGNNSGLAHKWTDKNVTDGVTYWYSVTAYDRGVVADPELNPNGWALLNYLESAKGTNPNASPNLVQVVIGKRPANFVDSHIQVEALPGTYANQVINVKIIDPFVITGHSYMISFNDTSGTSTTFSLKDEQTGTFLIKDSPDINGQVSPIMEGMTIAVQQKFSNVAFDPDSIEWFNRQWGTPAVGNWKFSGAMIANEPFDYEIRFTEELDTAFFPITYTVPFEIWNITLNQKARFAHYPPPNPADTTQEMKNTWTSGDELKVQEKVKGKNIFTFAFKLTKPPLKAVIDTITVSPDSMVFDTTYVDTSIAPVTGDICRLITGKPFSGKRDFFRLRTAAYSQRALQDEDLDKIKVVPNPYVISAEWDIDQYNKQISFTNLPVKCDIHIYTLSGERVNTIHHHSETEGWARWNMLSFNNQEVAYGCYIYVVETPVGKKKMGKFVILR